MSKESMIAAAKELLRSIENDMINYMVVCLGLEDRQIGSIVMCKNDDFCSLKVYGLMERVKMDLFLEQKNKELHTNYLRWLMRRKVKRLVGISKSS